MIVRIELIVGLDIQWEYAVTPMCISTVIYPNSWIYGSFESHDHIFHKRLLTLCKLFPFFEFPNSLQYPERYLCAIKEETFKI